MRADFMPDLVGYSGVEPFRFWCQKVLPLTYDDSLSYYELLCRVTNYINHIIDDLSASEQNIELLYNAFGQLQNYVNTYFDDLDVASEIDRKLDQMARTGVLTALVQPAITDVVEDWLEENITPTEPIVDASLTVEGAAADAKATGVVRDRMQEWIHDLVDYSMPDINDNVDAWTIGSLNAETGGLSGSNLYMRTKLFYPVDEKYRIKFDGVVVGSEESYDRFFYIYYYDKDYSFIERTTDTQATEGARYMKMIYGFNSHQGKTVEGYGLSNMVRDFHASIYNGSTQKDHLNILAIGNSFTQDSFAYFPLIMRHLLPNKYINVGVAYKSDAKFETHVDMYNAVVEDDKKYGAFSSWKGSSNKWSYYIRGSGDRDDRKTLDEILEWDDWDIIYLQPRGKMYFPVDDYPTQADIDTYMREQYYVPGRQLIRIIQDKLPNTMIICGSWLSVKWTNHPEDHGEHYFPSFVNTIHNITDNCGFAGFIPFHTAFQNARSNPVFQEMGDSELKNMLYDNTHMQSGVPALLATYTAATYICKLTGNMYKGVYGDTWEPTNENAIAISAYHGGHPNLMTHGNSVGVNGNNIALIQAMANMAVQNPDIIVDCDSWDVV